MIINILPASTQSVRVLAMSYVFLALTHQYDVDWWKRDIYTYSGGSGQVIGYNQNHKIDGLVQERRNSSALTMELHLSCTNLSKLVYTCAAGWELPPPCKQWLLLSCTEQTATPHICLTDRHNEIHHGPNIRWSVNCKLLTIDIHMYWKGDLNSSHDQHCCVVTVSCYMCISTLRMRQNFADNLFKCIILHQRGSHQSGASDVEL